MSWLKRLWSRVSDRVARWIVPPYKTVLVDDLLPSSPIPRTLYIVQEDGFVEMAAMICPCGCGRVLQMNLLPDERPYWSVQHHPDGTSTLNPSVWRKTGCQSHFWFRQGRIIWCQPT